ncbi:unnamed protein product [Auanema sp. JU1783]|nr:unnamed protein product [Auanema sp. JU1783]
MIRMKRYAPNWRLTGMNDVLWYEEPLDMEDFVAGGSLLLVAMFSIALYIIILRTMRKHDKEIVGYRFLISAGVCDILLLINYGVWPGLTILFKSEIISKPLRHWMQLYLDWAWFSMVWHYSLIAWSRWSAIRHPIDFRSQARKTSYMLCSFCYIISLIQVLCTHFQPWYVTFYYDPSSYGMLAEDFDLYMSGGQSAMFLGFHIIAIIPPCIFYNWSLILLIRRRRNSVITSTPIAHLHNNIESRLLLPCVINLIMFVFGQVLITYGTGEGKWAGWTVMMLFCTNSSINTALLLVCSASIRQQVYKTLGVRCSSAYPQKHEAMIFRNNMAIGNESKMALELDTGIANNPLNNETTVFV